MDRTVLDWLLEDKNPEVKLRTLKEYEHYPEDNEKVIACKKELFGKTGTNMMRSLALPNGG